MTSCELACGFGHSKVMNDPIFDVPFVGLYHHVVAGQADEFVKPFYERLNQAPYAEGKEICENAIAELDAQETGAEKERRGAILAARATVRTNLADRLRSEHEYDLAYENLRTALLEARESRDDQAHFRALHSLGVHRALMGEPHGAVYWFMRSMMYAHAHWPYNLDMTLTWLIDEMEQLGRESEALFFRDWKCTLWPSNLQAQLDKFNARIKAGKEADVVARAEGMLGNSCEEIGQVLAANRALGREDEAREAAEAGLALAQARGDRHWILAFAGDLGMDTMKMLREMVSKSVRDE